MLQISLKLWLLVSFLQNVVAPTKVDITPDQLVGHQGPIFSIAFAPNGNLLATAGTGGQIKLWDIKSKRLIKTLVIEEKKSPFGGLESASIRSLQFSQNGETLTNLDWFWGQRLRCWDVKSGRQLQCLDLKEEYIIIDDVAYNPDSKTVAITGLKKKTNQSGIFLVNILDGSEIKGLTFPRLARHRLRYAPNGETMAMISSEGTLTFLSTQNLQIVKTAGMAQEMDSIGYSLDGNSLFVACANTLMIWDVQSGRFSQIIRTDGFNICAAAFSSDGTLVLSACNDSKIRGWNVHTGELKLLLEGGQCQTRFFSVDTYGELVASGGQDGIVRLWDLSRMPR